MLSSLHDNTQPWVGGNRNPLCPAIEVGFCSCCKKTGAPSLPRSATIRAAPLRGQASCRVSNRRARRRGVRGKVRNSRHDRCASLRTPPCGLFSSKLPSAMKPWREVYDLAHPAAGPPPPLDQTSHHGQVERPKPARKPNPEDDTDFSDLFPPEQGADEEGPGSSQNSSRQAFRAATVAGAVPSRLWRGRTGHLPSGPPYQQDPSFPQP